MIVTKGIPGCSVIWDAGIDMLNHQPAVLSAIVAVLSPSQLDATQEQENRSEHKLEQWRTLEEFWDIYSSSNWVRGTMYRRDGRHGLMNPPRCKSNKATLKETFHAFQ
jgi:hypothetical protein